MKYKIVCVFFALSLSTSVFCQSILLNNFSFLTDEFQANTTFYLSYMKKKMLNYVTHELLTDFLAELLVLRKYKDLEMRENDLNTLIDTIDYGDFSIDELLVFRSQMLLLSDRNEVIHNEEHLQTHILRDIKNIFAYMDNEFHLFKDDLHQIEDMFDFECKMRKVRSQLGEVLEMINIFYFWFQALNFFPDKDINESSLRRSMLDRLILERPHWLEYFVMYPVPNLNMTMFYYL